VARATTIEPFVGVQAVMAAHAGEFGAVAS
jgi:hypothetical protein